MGIHSGFGSLVRQHLLHPSSKASGGGPKPWWRIGGLWLLWFMDFDISNQFLKVVVSTQLLGIAASHHFGHQFTKGGSLSHGRPPVSEANIGAWTVKQELSWWLFIYFGDHTTNTTYIRKRKKNLLWFLCYAVSRHWMIPRTFWQSDVGDLRNQEINVCSLWFNQQTLEVHGSSVANTGRDLEWTTSRNQILLPNFRQLWVRFKVFSGDTSSVDELATWVDAAVGDVESGSFGTEHHWDTPEGLMKVWRVYLIRPLTFGGFKHVFCFVLRVWRHQLLWLVFNLPRGSKSWGLIGEMRGTSSMSSEQFKRP